MTMNKEDLVTSPPPTGEISLNVTTFKARCLEIFKALEARKLTSVTITRRGTALARLTPTPAEAVSSLWGAHPGSVRVADGVDLTEPALDEPVDAELGRLYR